MNSRGGSRPWRRLRDRVIREEPECRLRLPGCTGVSTTADHIVPKSIRPDWVMKRENLRGACQPCNLKRGNKMYMMKTRAIVQKQVRARALEFFE